ncbi:MAG: peptidase S8, partial [Sphingobacteriales bacterium]|nr:peptidase S8 [Sphingobacteriales bacterium]
MNKFSFLFSATLTLSISSFAQTAVKAKEELPKNWHQLDKDSTGFYGISLDKAYSFVKSKKLKSKTVVVAVIDSGIDTLHEDLKPVLWTNPKEIPFNGIDDDKNGYIDDIHGWNFIGGKDGRNVKEDSYEAARVYHQLKAKYSNYIPDATSAKPGELAEYKIYKKAEGKVVKDVDLQELAFVQKILPIFKTGDSVIRKDLKKEEYNCNDLSKYVTTDTDAKLTKGFLMKICEGNNSNE